MKPAIGRIVHYVMSEADCSVIRHEVLQGHIAPRGINLPQPGDILPLVICRVWNPELYDGKESINGQVLLDGPCSHWVTSVHPCHEIGKLLGTWHWPQIPSKPGGDNITRIDAELTREKQLMRALEEGESIASRLCELIEGAGASEELTGCSIVASQLRQHLANAQVTSSASS